jgi:hypothetical protein
LLGAPHQQSPISFQASNAVSGGFGCGIRFPVTLS